jgi:tungstate transport system substrate-binding protein
MRGVTGLVLLATLLLAGCAREAPSFTIATTTSVDASGLMTHLAFEFRSQRGIEVNWLAVGSGRALRMAAAGDVDVAITHDPAAEKALAAGGRVTLQRPFARNDFVIVGPAADPAGVRAAASAAEAMARIHRQGAAFLSRSDESGTHAREMLLWKGAGIDPSSNGKYIRTGQPMGALLRSAGDQPGYALSDRATFERMRSALALEVLSAGDPALENVYTVTLMAPSRRKRDHAFALTFAEWLVSAEGQAAIASFRVDGRPLFQGVAGR